MTSYIKEKLKIYVALASQKDLSRQAGDVLNEIETYKKFSSFGEVYYNGQLIQWGDPNYGIEPRELSIPNEKYDLYYLRNAPQLYDQCPGPLLIMGYPYDSDVWSNVDGIVVTNHSWKEFLETFNSKSKQERKQDPWYPNSIVQPKHIVVFEQSLATHIKPQQNSKITKMYRCSFGSGFNIGFLGRVDPTCYPHQAIAAINKIRSKDNRVTFTFLGNIRDVEIPNWVQTYYRQPMERMSYVISAFDCLIYDQDMTGHYMGSNKCLEAMACGVPILVRRYNARIEQFGENYPLYYDDSKEAEYLIMKLKEDTSFASDISEYLLKQSTNYLKENVEQRFKNQVFDFLERQRLH